MIIGIASTPMIGRSPAAHYEAFELDRRSAPVPSLPLIYPNVREPDGIDRPPAPAPAPPFLRTHTHIPDNLHPAAPAPAPPPSVTFINYGGIDFESPRKERKIN